MRLKNLGITAAALFALVGTLSAQEWRQGKGRVEGNVTDEKGQVIPDAKVSLRLGETGKGPDLTANKKGHWAILGLNGGSWTVEVSAPGYRPFKQAITVLETQHMPPVDIQLGPAQQAAAAPAEPVTTVNGQKISKEAAEAIQKANTAIHDKNFAAAEEDYGKALAELPDNPSLLRNLALAYYFDKKFDDALKYAHLVVLKDETAADAWLMIAELELQKGNLDEGRNALSKVPDDRVTSPEPYLNVGILYYNKGKSAEAEEFFTKAAAKSPETSMAYYYRGLARYQQKKTAESKSDFQKYLELEPNGTEAGTVREILKTIK
jgi:Flp pilus assembly protein TadD